MGVSEAEPEPATADEDFGFPLKTKKKKKGKKGADIEGPSGAATPVPGAVGTGGDLGINVQEMLGDLLGGDAEQAATPTAEKEDDDWGLPVKTKKKKAKGGGKKK
ncbi:hypothetical protein FA13DRAFT_1490066 [Coprinellus micaceus]|uniref:Uncharacterized protein n=1 Tax=Coprinellus micaceus TaxID=71717 RepID=A0A4Y7TKV2_COPMI|nr:hypothetical protein FA13DRAFT_1490066 [Coprinellus micaceus]